MNTEPKEYIEFFYKKIAERIKSKRKELNLTQEKLAGKINVGTKIISNAEQNRRTSKNRYLLSESIIDELLIIFDVSRKWLLFGDDDEQKQLTDCIFDHEKTFFDKGLQFVNDTLVPPSCEDLLIPERRKLYETDSRKVYNSNKSDIYCKMLEYYDDIANIELKRIEFHMGKDILWKLTNCVQEVYIDEMKAKQTVFYADIINKADKLNNFMKKQTEKEDK